MRYNTNIIVMLELEGIIRAQIWATVQRFRERVRVGENEPFSACRTTTFDYYFVDLYELWLV
jgi:hypothetical protein